MSEPSDFEEIPQVYPPAGLDSRIASLLSQLVFKEHGARLGLEITGVITAYTLLYAFVPWSALGFTPAWQGLIAWFSACIGVTVLDRVFISRSLYTYLESCRLDFVGAYDLALKKIRTIAPHSGSFVPCPEDVYHTLRAKIFIHAGEYERANRELEKAHAVGVRAEDCYALIVYLHVARGDFALALTVLDEAKEKFGGTPWLALEMGFVRLSERRMPEAKAAFKEAAKAAALPHASGDTTAFLGEAFVQVCQLWTGEAEEGIEGLEGTINRYRALALTVESLRPIVSTLLLERALYFATHREPVAAISDVRVALAFCSYPSHLDLATKVKDELEWRYPNELFGATQPSPLPT